MNREKAHHETAQGQLRVSQRLRDVLSDCVSQFIARLMDVSRIHVQDLLGVRTLNSEHILASVKSIYVLESGSGPNPAMDTVIDYATEKVNLFKANREQEKGKKEHQKHEKEEALSPEERDALEAARANAEAQKKAQALERFKRMAFENAKKAKELESELAVAPPPVPSTTTA